MRSGLWYCMLETTVVANALAGPWQGDVFMGQLVGAASAFFKNTDSDGDLFLYFFQRVGPGAWLGVPHSGDQRRSGHRLRGMPRGRLFRPQGGESQARPLVDLA